MDHDRFLQWATFTASSRPTQQMVQAQNPYQQASNRLIPRNSSTSNTYATYMPLSASPAQPPLPLLSPPLLPRSPPAGSLQPCNGDESQNAYQNHHYYEQLQPGGVDAQGQSYAYQAQDTYQNAAEGNWQGRYAYMNMGHKAQIASQTYNRSIPTYTGDDGTRAKYQITAAQLPEPRNHEAAGAPHGITERMASIALEGQAPMYQTNSQAQIPMGVHRPQFDGIPELNILVLGETGVGKSTFINAFANYIYYGSLDDALRTRDLQCVIPSSFTWQSLVGDDYVSRTIHVSPNSGEFIDKALQDERDGTQGQSATQSTKHYIMRVNNTQIRLIDTPGIGDTRGATHDKRNMDNILGSLKSVDVLHGILILLKPNNARLGIMFTFCLKELLTHLHRDAAKNIVFGFTNARNTSFRPGETYATLQSMLDSDKTVGIHLDRNITYCFDSESFRCLAAHNNNINIHDMGDIRDYRLSREKSAAETYRMLEHFTPRNTKPHQVSETWDLYTTRELVRVLTIPMADITQNINNNIALQKDEQRELTDALAKGQALSTALHLSKVVYEIKALDMPRTVCSSAKCVEFKDGERHYKTRCHDPCYLENVEVDQFPCEALMHCHAFRRHGPDRCKVCGHSWQLHLHIMWEPVEKTVQVKDEAVALRKKEARSAYEIMHLALRRRQELIRKWEMERAYIQKAAGQFAVFLKRSSIKPWNDSKLAYLDHLIEEEKNKVQAGGSDKRLRDLCADRRQHLEEISTLTQYVQAGKQHVLLDQQGIKSLIQQLYSLELTGPNLKKVAQQLEDIQNATVEKSKQNGASGSSKFPRTQVSPTHLYSQRRGYSSDPASSGHQQDQYGQQSGGGVSGMIKGLFGN
ncbi:unnamed protein product [Cercospora beticola]|nr:unnamed protein product [Cercospora beticola]